MNKVIFIDFIKADFQNMSLGGGRKATHWASLFLPAFDE
jgi:hypothetical protein